MNKIFKVKYNAQTGQYIVVSEMAKNAGKIGKVLTAFLATVAMPTAIAVGPDGVSNDRPSYLASRINPTQADSTFLTDFRSNPLQWVRYHQSAGENSTYYKVIFESNRDGLLSSGGGGGSDTCINSGSLIHCNYSDRTKVFRYTADYAIEAVKVRDSEIEELKKRGTLDSNNIWSNGIGGTVDLTPGGDNNKEIYTLSGGHWDEINLRNIEPKDGYFRNAEALLNIASSETLGVSAGNTDKNSGLYRALYVDNATLNVDNSAVFWSRPTSHRATLYVTDGGVVNFNGQETVVLHTQGAGHAVNIGDRKEFPNDNYYGKVNVKGNFTVSNFNSYLHSRNILVGTNDKSVDKESSQLNIDGNLKSVQQSDFGGSASVNVFRSGVISVNGTSDMRSYVRRLDAIPESQSVLRVENGKFYGKGNVNVGFHPSYRNAYRVEEVQGIRMMGGLYLNEAKTTIELPASKSQAYLGETFEGERSFADIKGGIQTIVRAEPNNTSERWRGSRVLTDSTGIKLNGGDMHVGDNIDVDMIFLGSSKGIELIDGELIGDKNLNITVERKNDGGEHEEYEKNNTAVEINGKNAHLAVANTTNILVNTKESKGVAITKGEVRLGNLGERNTGSGGIYEVNTHNQENAVLDFSKGSIVTTRSTSNAIVLSPEDTKSATYTQKEGVLVKTTGENSNGILVKQADNTDVNFDVTIHGKVEQTGVNAKDGENDQFATVNVSGTGSLIAGNTAEILNDAEQVAILKRDNGNIVADVAAKVIGRVMLTGEGENSLTLSENADSEASNMKVIDGGKGGKASNLTLKSAGYLLNAYTTNNIATQPIPVAQSVSQLLNWNTISLDTTSTTADNFVRLNLVGDIEVKDKVSIGTNNWLTKRETQTVKLTTALLENNGTIDLRDNQFGANNTLTVTGDYVGNSGRLLMNTNWNRTGMDENGGGSQSDLFHIQGSASGTTQVIPTTKNLISADSRILGDVAIKDADMEKVGDEVKSLQSQTSTEKIWLYSTNFAKRINSVVVVKVDGQDNGNSFQGSANVDDGTEVQLANRETTNGGREYYWTMYGTRQATRTEKETITPPSQPSDPITPPSQPSDPITPPSQPSDPITPPSQPSDPITPPSQPNNPIVPQKPLPLLPVESDDIPTVQPKVPVYVNTPSANLELGYTTIANLHERRGENQATAWDSCGCVQEKAEEQAWVRLFGKHLDKDGKYRFNQEQDIYGVQVGWDWKINYNRENGSRNHSGAYLSYTRGLTDHFDRFRRENGQLSSDKYMGNTKTNGYSLGLTHTRYAKSGGYIDGVLQFSYLQNTHNPRNTAENVKQNGYAIAGSLEVGKPYVIGKQNRNEGGWIIEPQAQLTYQFLDLGKLKGENLNVKIEETHGLLGRAGFRLAHNRPLGKFTETIYFSADILHRIVGGGDTSIVGTTATREYSEKSNHTWWQVGLGGQIPISKHSYLYASAHYEHSFSGTKRKGYRGSVGYRLTW